MIPDPTDRPALIVYQGHVMHMRLIPKRHQFRYRVFTVLMDLDRMDVAFARSRIIRRGKFGILSFHDADHGPRDGSDLRPWVEARLAAQNMARPDRIELLSFPRLWGFVFNPLSVYFCYDAQDRLYATVYEVKNTFGGQEAYTLPVHVETEGVTHQEQQKSFWVSPFIAMNQRYRFTVARPDARLRLRIKQSGPEGETLIATQTAKGRPATDRALLGAIASHPLMTLKVIIAIHWQAARLLAKGVPFLGARNPDVTER